MFCKFVIHLALSPATSPFYIMQSKADDRDFSCRGFGETDRSWMFRNWKPSRFLAQSILICFFFFFPSPFPGLQVISHVQWEKLRKFSEAKRKIQTHRSYYPKIAGVEDSGFCTFSIFIHTLKLYTFLNSKNVFYTMHRVL